MKTMTYKQALSFNRKLRNKYNRNEINFDSFWDNKINLFVLVKDDLTTDQDLPAKLKAVFHWGNENGLVKQLPLYEDFEKNGSFFRGGYVMYSQHENYHAKKLMKLALQSQPKRWDVDYHTRQLANDLEGYKEWKKEVYDKK